MHEATEATGQGGAEDRRQIDELVRLFFRAFTNKRGARPAVESLRELFIAEGVIVKNSGAAPEIYNLGQFIEPRLKLLTEGRLTDFAEEEYDSRTDVVGRVAQRLCFYRKEGVLDGQRFAAQGGKTLQFIKTASGWRITAVAWDDEREGFVLPARLEL